MNMPIFVEWADPDQKHQVNQCPVVHFLPDGERVVIVHKKAFITVPLNQVRFARWDY